MSGGGLFEKWGIPDEILSDNGGQFLANEWRDFGREHGIELRYTTPYNPQSNPTERIMRELGRAIRLYCNEEHTRWYQVLRRFEKTVNSTVHSSTNYAPYMLHDRRDLMVTIPQELRAQPEENETWEQKKLKVDQTLQIAAAKRRRQADKKQHVEYEEGQQVLLRTHKLSNQERKLSRKICLVYEGPFIIQQIVRRNAYLLAHPDGRRLGVHNSRQIRPYRTRRMMG